MKLEITGTPEEIAELILQLQNKKVNLQLFNEKPYETTHIPVPNYIPPMTTTPNISPEWARVICGSGGCCSTNTSDV